jgi:hypothetical protein
MDLTECAVLAIQRPAIEAESLKKQLSIVDSPDPRCKYVVQAGTHVAVSVPPPFRQHKVYSLQDLIACYCARESSNQVLWHSAGEVVLILDDEDRRDRVTFPMPFSDAWDLLRKLDVQKQPLTQRDFIRMLRIYFGANEAVITAFRKLDWQTHIKTAGELDRGKESLGRAIESEVRGTRDLPEDLCFEVPIYDCCGERDCYSVRLLLEYDVQSQSIYAIPVSDILDEMVELHQRLVFDRLRAALGESARIYFGIP